MPPDAAPLAVTFADLFDHLGTEMLRYSENAKTLSGRSIAIEGFLAHSHGPDPSMMLVDQPGFCPDCSPAPAAAITLFGARGLPQAGEPRPVRVVGRLDFGFRIDEGVASFLRIEQAALTPAGVSA